LRSGAERCGAVRSVEGLFKSGQSRILCHQNSKRGGRKTLAQTPDKEELLEGDLQVEEQKPATKQPPSYKVILLNDDYTPMEFVVHVLEVFFGYGREQATQIMLAVHTQGSAVVGMFTRDVAETKSEQVNNYAQSHDHPLMSRVEAAD